MRLSLPHLSAAQQAVVQQGFEAGLSRHQISVYADPKFDPAQMEEIRLAFLDGLSVSDARTLADPRISAAEMRRMRTICRTAAGIEEKLQSLDEMVQRSERCLSSAPKHALLDKLRTQQRRRADHEGI